jgi:hypothetical protein
MANRWSLIKMDQDLSLLSQRSQALRSAHCCLLVVDFGYAVDALCVGALTRYQHDMDVRLIVPLDVMQQEVVRSALRILNEQSNCSWKLHLDEANPSWVAFCMGDPHVAHI